MIQTHETLAPDEAPAAACPRRHFFPRFVAAIWPPLLFLTCSLILFREAILDGKVFFENDTLLFYQPIARLFDYLLDQGRLPLWTPYIFAGHPLFADGEAGMLYPPNLIAYLLLPAGPASIVLRILRFFLAASFAYLYGRSLRLNKPAASTVGLAFGFGSFMVGQMHHTNVGNTALWLPLVLTGIEHAVRSSSTRSNAYLLLSGVAFGFAALTVHANPLMMMVMLAGLYLLFRLFVSDDVRFAGVRDRLRLLGVALVLAFGTGLAVGAVQLWPLWELASFSRGQGVGYDFATGFATPPANALTLVLPYFFRDASDGYWSPWFRWSTTIYVGVAPLLLAAVAVFLKRVRIVWFYAAVAIVGLLLAFGDYLPLRLYGLLYQLPVVSTLRGPSRFLYWTAFALAVLAGLGLQRLFDARERASRPGLRRFLLGASGAVLAIPALLYATHYVTSVAPEGAKAFLQANYLSLRGANLERTLARDQFAALRYSLDLTNPWTLRATLWLALAVALLWLWYRKPDWPKVWALLLLALVGVDLLSFAGRLHPSMSLEALQSAGGVGRFLEARAGTDRVLTLWPAFDTWPNRLLPLRVAEASGYSSLAPRRHEQFIGRAVQGNTKYLDLLGVRYVIASTNHLPQWLRGQPTIFQDGATAVYERLPALPRAYLVREATVGSAAQVLAGILDPAFDPKATVWLEEAPTPEPEVSTAGAPHNSPTDERVNMVAYGNEEIKLQVETSSAAYLVLGDSFYPGWSATVDGSPAKVYRANYLFRAVPLPAGKHTVRFAFDPISFRVGAAISIFGAVGTLGVAILYLAAAGRLGFRRLLPSPSRWRGLG